MQETYDIEEVITELEPAAPEKNVRVRLLIIGPLPPPYIGPAVATDRLLKSPELRERFDIEFLNTSDREGIGDIGRLSWHNISFALHHGWQFLGILIRRRPAIVYIPIDRAFWGFIRDLLFLVPARLLGVRTLVHLRAGRFDLRHDYGLLGKLIARIGLSGVSRGMVLGECVRDVFGKNIPADRIRVVPNGMDLTSWPRIDHSAKPPCDRFRVVYLANLYEGKGARVMLSTIPRLVESIPNIEVTFAGNWIDESFRSQCLGLVASLGLEKYVRFSGGVGDAQKKELLANSDILVFVPIEPEGLPWVVLEAMAASLPVIGTPQGTMREVIIDGETGFLVQPGDCDALARKIEILARDRELRHGMGENGRRRVEQIYSEPIAHRALVEVAMETMVRPLAAGMPVKPTAAVVHEDVPVSDGLSEVRAFWDVEACGTQFVKEQKRTVEFYEKFRQFRYRTEWHIPLMVPFQKSSGAEVLEIGCGNGADGAMFARNGAHYTGVDLTPEAIEATRVHFEVLGLDGRFQVENAEHLSFPDNSFDMVYSHGVLHHTPHPTNAFEEVYRVLKPGGKAIIMLYHKNSFNYYFRVMGFMRLRALGRILRRMYRWSSDRQELASTGLLGVRGNRGAEVWELHYRNFLRSGWSYLKPKNFIHHATDGPECPFAFVYTRKQVLELFSRFSEVDTRIAHFPLNKYGLTSRFVFPIEKFLASKIGWSLFVYVTK